MYYVLVWDNDTDRYEFLEPLSFSEDWRAGRRFIDSCFSDFPVSLILGKYD